VGFPDTGILCVLVSGNFWVYNGFVDQRCRAVGGWVGAGTSTCAVYAKRLLGLLADACCGLYVPTYLPDQEYRNGMR